MSGFIIHEAPRICIVVEEFVVCPKPVEAIKRKHPHAANIGIFMIGLFAGIIWQSSFEFKSGTDSTILQIYARIAWAIA